MKNIVLTGLSGSGKTTLGRLLAEALDLCCVDLDDMIEEHMGMEIKDIFEQYGEAHFRDVEAAMAQKAAAMERTVIATGGGTVLREESMVALRKTGVVVFLDRAPEIIVASIACDARPMLAAGAEKLFELSRKRRELYLKTAHITYKNDGRIEDGMAGLLALVRGEDIGDGYAVIGDPIVHSLSPVIHNEILGALGCSCSYRAVHVPRGQENLELFVKRARKAGLRGFNITAPHKQDVLPFLDEIEEEALQCRSVNTVVRRGKRLCGYNTDMDGLLLALQDTGHEYRESCVMVLGTGGAAAGVVLKAAREGAREIILLGRNQEAAQTLCKQAGEVAEGQTEFAWGGLEEEALTNAAQRSDVLINTIPVGEDGIPSGFPSLDFLEALDSGVLVCDMVYSPPRTRLLDAAQERGIANINGLPMLIYQAILADEYYLERSIDRKAMYQQVSCCLKEQGVLFADACIKRS